MKINKFTLIGWGLIGLGWLMVDAGIFLHIPNYTGLAIIIFFVAVLSFLLSLHQQGYKFGLPKLGLKKEEAKA